MYVCVIEDRQAFNLGLFTRVRLVCALSVYVCVHLHVCVCDRGLQPGIVHQGQASVCIECMCCALACMCDQGQTSLQPGIVHQGQTSVCIECVCMCALACMCV